MERHCRSLVVENKIADLTTNENKSMQLASTYCGPDSADECKQGIVHRKTISSFTFTSEIKKKERKKAIANSLTVAGKMNEKKRDRGNLELLPTAKRGPKICMPIADVQYDGVCHWPQYTAQKQMCRNCKLGFTRIMCKKCKVGLCLNVNYDSFLDFHS
ncbi:hypothetical protein ANN_21486 [Periplaneta americana]|uniref:PiggyBac transposable element-derived protein 4 C-terminal zinc-ribbon domain-containing protein n=1 Tax=Periplaneta americana TaxID=6978 RepID=A0ABQ8SGN8_PERAM|nr:hypothetical protein ANN_21486 [Periplaneta americana]